MSAAAWLDQETIEKLTALVDAPQSVPAAREHWKYSKLSDARATLPESAPEGDAVAPNRIPGAAQAVLADTSFCPLTSEAVLTDLIQPHIIDVAAGETAEVLHDDASDQRWVICLVRRDARLSYHTLRTEADSSAWTKVQIVTETGAEVSMNTYATGGRFRRMDLSVDLEGAHSRFEFTGAAAASGADHLDLQAHIRHHAPNTSSTTRWHTIGTGKATLNFRGRIYIAEHCNGVDASLNNRNLALEQGVTVNTKPELEIYSDDVRCAHGATVGQLDDAALFYLRSRGVPEAHARTLLAHGFLNECISGPYSERAQQTLTETLA